MSVWFAITCSCGAPSTPSATAPLDPADAIVADKSKPEAIAVTPAAVAIASGTTQKFTAKVSGTGSTTATIVWSAQLGSIDASGVYTAPAAPGTDTVTATVSGKTVHNSAAVTVTGNGSSSGGTTGGSAGGSTGGSETIGLIVEPSDDGAGLVAAINGAQTSVHMTMYELSAATVMTALESRAAAGVEVKVVLDSSTTTSSLNEKAYKTLQAAGVEVVWSSTAFTYTHEKCVVIDSSVAWIMTMNAATSSLSKNREYLAIDSNAADVAEAEAQFAADFALTAYTPAGSLLMSPVTSRPGIENLLNGAQKTIDFEVEEIGDPTITSDFCAAVARGVTVRGCLAAITESPTEATAVAQLKSCGVTLVSLVVPYIHGKAIAADASSAFIGSENFSTNSLDYNRELGLVTEDPSFVATVAATIAADINAGTAL